MSATLIRKPGREPLIIPYRNILLIQTGFVGDMVLTTPLIRALRENGTRSNITLLCAPRAAGIVRHCPHLDGRIVYDKEGREKGAAAFFRLARRLRGLRFDLVISPHRSVRSGLLSLLTGAERRIGFDHPSCGLFHTDALPYSRWKSTFIRRKLRLLEPLGIEEADETPELYWGAEEERVASALLRESGAEPPYAILAVGAAWATKRWPPEQFAKLARQLRGQGISSVAIGGEADRAAGRIVAERGGSADLTGRTSLETAAVLLRDASLFVGNDSGTLHMARAARIPSIALFGPTGPEQFLFDSLVKVVRSTAPCAPCSDHGTDECPAGNWICLPGIDAGGVAREASALLNGTPREESASLQQKRPG